MNTVSGKQTGAKAVSGFPILTYHSIDESGSVISTTPAAFRRQLQTLSDAGYRSITLRELAGILGEAQPLPTKTIVLTFDDGFRNFMTEAYPLLSQFGFNATVFLVTDLCGKHNDWAGNPANLPRSEILSWEQIRDLDAAGIEFGSHTRTHADLTLLPRKAVEAELNDSKKKISDKLGRETVTFAYPYGRNNAASRGLARETYSASCSTDLGKIKAGTDVARLNRIDTYYLRNEKVFRALPTARFDNYMLLRHALRRVKSVLT